MSLEDERRVKADVLLELTESQQRFAAVKEVASRMASDFEGVAKALRQNPDNLALDVLPAHFNREPIGRLISDHKAARTELDTVAERAQRLGLKL